MGFSCSRVESIDPPQSPSRYVTHLQTSDVVTAPQPESTPKSRNTGVFDVREASDVERPYFEALLQLSPREGRRERLALIADVPPAKAVTMPYPVLVSVAFNSVKANLSQLRDIFDAAQCNATQEASDDTRPLDTLGADAIVQLASLLSATPRDDITLFFLHKLGCRAGPWILHYDTWVSGCVANFVFTRDAAAKLYAQCAESFVGLALGDEIFTDFYSFLFDFVKPASGRCIPVEDAITLWESVLVPRWEGGRAWCSFVSRSAAANPRYHVIFRDLWQQIAIFAHVNTWPHCPEADMDTAWPTLIDNFVDDCRHPSTDDSHAST